MDAGLAQISWLGLAISMLPAAVVIAIMWRWSANPRTGVYATLRMLVQLLLIGYVLVFIFETDQPLVIGAVVLVMLVAASWIAMRPVPTKTAHGYAYAFGAIAVGALSVLTLVIGSVVGVEPWFNPRYVVPLAGMAIASSMNTVSLAAERWESECRAGGAPQTARRAAFEAALIPTVNSLFAVGLVTLPGMMTGQILSGVSPLVAAKYQIVVMAMLLSTAGISGALYLLLAQRRLAT